MSFDVFTRIGMFRPKLSVYKHRREVKKARDLLLGALLVGPDADPTNGWWTRKNAPLPVVYETPRAVGMNKGSNVQYTRILDWHSKAITDEELFEIEVWNVDDGHNFKARFESFAWDYSCCWSLCPVTPGNNWENRLVRGDVLRCFHDQTRWGERVNRMSHIDFVASDLWMKHESGIRAAVDVWAGGPIVAQEDMHDCMRAMEPHWYRAACATLTARALWTKGWEKRANEGLFR